MMMNKRISTVGVFATLVVCGSLDAAPLSSHPQQELARLKATAAGAKISLARAVAVAEEHTAGRAVEAELSARPNHAIYEVDILQGERVVEIEVDGLTGKVLSTKPDD
jgi:uncharacterized membrane protein YkoI